MRAYVASLITRLCRLFTGRPAPTPRRRRRYVRARCPVCQREIAQHSRGLYRHRCPKPEVSA